jgi:PIN domain nuclease of toxin-antitoxin system
VKLLLDTHIWLWSVFEPRKLSTRVSRELTDARNELWLSAVSIWELQMLVRKKRVKLEADTGVWVAQNLTALQLNQAPVTFEVALAVSSVKIGHGDPADQLLAASAKVFEMTLVTADERLINLRGIETLPNR